MLLAATLASLLVTIVAGYFTRLSLIEASAWVTHTYEVKLAIGECVHALDRSDEEALRNAESAVDRLTVDNPTQQRNIASAMLMTGRESHEELGARFATMQYEEDHLMAVRRQRIQSARARSSAAFVVGAALTIIFGIGTFLLLRTQRQDLAGQQALLEAIVESVDEGIIAVDPSRKIIAINAAARAMWGDAFPRDDWPKDWRPVLRATFEDGSPMAPEDGPLARAVRGETSEGVVYRIDPAGESAATNSGLWLSASARPIRDVSGSVVAAVTTLRDITALRVDADRLRDLTLTDEMTQLLNRRGFLARASERIAVARRNGAPTALLYADVNGLKKINDELGHAQGDRVIEDAARVLGTIFREGDVVARLGGDEFVALLPNFSAAAYDPLLERLAECLRLHAAKCPRPYRLSWSTGVTFIDWENERPLDELLAEADREMYERKRERVRQSMPVLRAISR